MVDKSKEVIIRGIKMTTDFKHEKMRRELKMYISQLRHFLDEESYKIDGINTGDLTIILDEVFEKYLDLIDDIERKVQNIGYPYDERDFRIKLKKLLLFINQVLDKLPSEAKYSLFKSDLKTVKEILSNQISILEAYYKKNCYYNGEPTLDD